jgi:uncharacterized Zn finger protein (UPF0148 family)
MPECKKCGFKVKEDMSFCPNCGASLREAAVAVPQPPAPPERPTHVRYEKEEKHEKQEKREKGEKHEKGEYGFIGPLIGGIVLIIIGLMSYLQVTGMINDVTRGILWAFFIVVVGLLLILGAIYAMTTARRRYPRT